MDFDSVKIICKAAAVSSVWIACSAVAIVTRDPGVVLFAIGGTIAVTMGF